jgi:hypothetical protein
VCLRLFLLFRVTKDIITTGHIRKESRSAIELTELFLLADLLWSGIPLGVLTLLELFVYGEGFNVRRSFPTRDNSALQMTRATQGDTMQIFELIKLVAVAVDALGAAYIIYFVILGLGRCCHLEGHDDEYEHISSKAPTIQAEKQSLVINHTMKENV